MLGDTGTLPILGRVALLPDAPLAPFPSLLAGLPCTCDVMFPFPSPLFGHEQPFTRPYRAWAALLQQGVGEAAQSLLGMLTCSRETVMVLRAYLGCSQLTCSGGKKVREYRTYVGCISVVGKQ